MLRWTRPSVRVLDGSLLKAHGSGHIHAYTSRAPDAGSTIHDEGTSAQGRPGGTHNSDGDDSLGDASSLNENVQNIRASYEAPQKGGRFAGSERRIDMPNAVVAPGTRAMLAMISPHTAKDVTSGLFGPSRSAHVPSPSPVNPSAGTTDTSVDAYTSNPSGCNALNSLRAFLAINLRQPLPSRMPTANTIKSLYTRVKARGQLAHLSSVELSALIAVFGTLSIVTPNAPRPQSYFIHPLAFKLSPHQPRTYWTFVFQVVRDKQSLKRCWSDSDHFWLMRAELAKALSSPPSGPSLARAGVQYRHLYLHTTDNEVHVPYLRALIETRSEACRGEAIEHICRLLEQQVAWTLELVALLGQLVLQHGEPLSPVMKDGILRGLWARVSELPVLDEEPPAQTSTPASTFETSRQSRSLLDPIVGAFQQALFGLHTGERLHAYANYKAWATSTMQTLLNPESTAIDTRWASITLLILLSGPRLATRTMEDLQLHLIPPTSTEAAQWLVIAALRVVESSISLSHVSRSRERRQHLQDFVWTLWRIWLREGSGGCGAPHHVERSVLATFLKIAVLVNVDIVEAILVRCDYRGLWSRETHAASDSAEELSIQALIAATTTRRDIVDLKARMGLSYSSTVVDKAASRLFRSDIEAAYRLCHQLDGLTTEDPDDGLFAKIASLHYNRRRQGAQTSVERGTRASSYANELLQSIPLVVARYKMLYSSTAQRLNGDLRREKPLTCIIPSSVHSQIEHALLILSRGPAIAPALQLALHLHEQDPHFLRLTFLECLLRNTLDRREFRAAEQLFCQIIHSHPQMLRSLRRTVISRLTQGGASSVALRAYRITAKNNYRQDRFLNLVRAVNFNLRQVETGLSLKAARLVKDHQRPSPSLYQQGMFVMVNTGRTLAAKRLFDRSRGQISERARSALGNMLLHALIQRRNRGRGRLMRRVLSTIATLRAEHGFVPDRVTVNIVLKALARWPAAVDASKLRVLFDTFVRHGYPAGKRFAEGKMPFGSSPTGGEYVPLLKEVRGPPHFKKHVRPMYKTFVKAFYLRGDNEAARVIIGLLKELGWDDEAKAERREHWRLRKAQVEREGEQVGSNASLSKMGDNRPLS